MSEITLLEVVTKSCGLIFDEFNKSKECEDIIPDLNSKEYMNAYHKWSETGGYKQALIKAIKIGNFSAEVKNSLLEEVDRIYSDEKYNK